MSQNPESVKVRISVLGPNQPKQPILAFFGQNVKTGVSSPLFDLILNFLAVSINSEPTCVDKPYLKLRMRVSELTSDISPASSHGNGVVNRTRPNGVTLGSQFVCPSAVSSAQRDFTDTPRASQATTWCRSASSACPRSACSSSWTSCARPWTAWRCTATATPTPAIHPILTVVLKRKFSVAHVLHVCTIGTSTTISSPTHLVAKHNVRHNLPLSHCLT